MSACNSQAMFHVGWRLAVASRAKIRRPRMPDSAVEARFILARKASISGRTEVVGELSPCEMNEGLFLAPWIASVALCRDRGIDGMFSRVRYEMPRAFARVLMENSRHPDIPTLIFHT